MKNRIKRVLEGVVLLVILGGVVTFVSSCGSSRYATGSNIMKSVNQIQKGMSPEDVKRILGDPQERTFDDNIEIWRYKVDVVLTNDYKYIEVGFHDGKVTYLNTFTRPFDDGPGYHPHP